jgi:endonuclease III
MPFSRKQKAQGINIILQKIFPNPKCELVYNQPFELLFAVIMSAQTTDKQVNKVTQKLFTKYKTLHDYINVDITELQSDISSIGLYRNKAISIQLTARKLLDLYNGEIPKTIDEIIQFRGAARKTANVVLWEIYGINEGMAVDTHIIRLANKLGLTKSNNPIIIEKDLTKLLTRDDWGNFGHRLILYGRYYWPANLTTHTGELNQFAIKKFQHNTLN